MPLLVKDKVNEHDLKVFEFFLEKYKAMYATMGMWLRASLTVNTAALAGILYLIKEIGGEGAGIAALNENPAIALPIACVGFVLALAWLLAGIDLRRWQLRMNKVLGEVEHAILQNSEMGMWYMTNKAYPPNRRRLGTDMADVGMLVPAAFMVVWAACVMYVILV